MENQPFQKYFRYRVLILVAALFLGLYFLIPESGHVSKTPLPPKVEKIREIVLKKDSALLKEKLRLEKELISVSRKRDSLRTLTVKLSNRQIIRIIADTSKNIKPVTYKNELGLFLDSVAIKDLAKLKIDVKSLEKEKLLMDSLYRNETLAKLNYQKAYDDTYNEFGRYKDSVYVANKKQKRKNKFTKILLTVGGFAIGRVKL